MGREEGVDVRRRALYAMIGLNAMTYRFLSWLLARCGFRGEEEGEAVGREDGRESR